MHCPGIRLDQVNEALPEEQKAGNMAEITEYCEYRFVEGNARLKKSVCFRIWSMADGIKNVAIAKANRRGNSNNGF
jgi:hypothetical protein